MSEQPDDKKTYQEVVNDQLSNAFGTSFKDTYKGDIPADELLEWQEMMDNAPASINMRGAHRFWHTVATLLGRSIYTDGSPDISEVVIPLTDKVGLLLIADYNKYIKGERECEPVLDGDWSVYMTYRFVDLSKTHNMSP